VSAADGGSDGGVFGWDVGGAHVKVSMADASGVLVDVAQWACPLWQGLEHLERTIDAVLARWPSANAPGARHGVTMTGEMVDLFGDRAEGVRVISRTLAARLGADTSFYAAASAGASAGASGWLRADECVAAWREVASANWHASARWVASRVPDAIFVDIGSTTTDIVPIVRGRVAARGSTDSARLQNGELVYQGVVRTPLCGVAHHIAFRGETTGVMNEWFATSADVYRLTGELWPPHDQYPAADNGPKTAAASRERLARMIGRDAAEASDADWRIFAETWRGEQLRAIGANVLRVASRHPELARAPIVGAGCGRFLAAALAQQESRSHLDFAMLGARGERAEALSEWISTCAPSAAVALLLASREFAADIA
jgi:probable H4MPT-linked C1 transfer pathway protein